MAIDQSILLLVAGSAVLLAGLVHGAIGLGFPMIAMPLLALLTDVETAILVTLIPTMLVNIISIMAAENRIAAIKSYAPLALIAMSGSALGTNILIVANPGPFKILLAVMILFYIMADSLRSDYRWMARRPRTAMLVFGLAAGLMGGLTNMMGPVLMIYFLALDHKPEVVVQGSNLCFLSGKLSQLIVFAYAGLVTPTVLLSSVPIAISGVIALLVGIHLRRRISVALYRQLLKKALFVVACILCGQGVIQY